MSSQPLRVTDSDRSWPLHDAARSRRIEADAQATQAPGALMARAGLALARLALALAPHARRVAVWAGPGNNGGDGLVAARHLHLAGVGVFVHLLADASRLPADAADALRAARAAGVPLADARPCADPADLCIDALLGLGVARPPQGAIAEAITRINAARCPVLAVDLPSGLHPDTGCAMGETAVRASHTLALLTLKPGCHTAQGRDHAGQVWLDTLGVASDGATARLAGAPARVARQHATHKGSFGDVIVVGGDVGMAGAAALAARAALASGAGRVYCGLLDPAAPTLDPAWPELMVRPPAWCTDAQTLAQATVVCGCGGGPAVRGVLPALLSRAARLVLDADALNAVAADAAMSALLKARARHARPTLLTPHPLEAARLLDCPASAVQADRLAAARRLADETGATVLLKGSGSVLVAAGGLPVLNATGNAALASAGSGDVLAGWAAGTWAQTPAATALEVAQEAAWWHGRAADRFLARGQGRVLRASALVDAMAALVGAPAAHGA